MDVTLHASPGLASGKPPAAHLTVLDGWRGLSIICVLASHLLPLGEKAWQVNVSIGIFGMVLFFNLSGFLITSFLLKDQHLGTFMIRRLCRVLPLAWLYLVLALVLSDASLYAWYSHLLFFANMPPQSLLPMTAHIWSLCVEVQFYFGVALLVLLLGRRGLYLLPFLAIGFTLLRAHAGIYANSFTYYRVDEILAGSMLALFYHEPWGRWWRVRLARIPQTALFFLLIACCMPFGEWLNYFRPYVSALLLGATLLNPNSVLVRYLHAKVLVFLAGISYALYIIHPMLVHSWLGSGDLYVRYEKRPLLLLVLFALAYLSTRYYESYFIGLGKRWTQGFRKQPSARAEPLPMSPHAPLSDQSVSTTVQTSPNEPVPDGAPLASPDPVTVPARPSMLGK